MTPHATGRQVDAATDFRLGRERFRFSKGRRKLAGFSLAVERDWGYCPRPGLDCRRIVLVRVQCRT